ncbi:MAG: hypothetical protein WD404_09655 [Solirubrobacterales bacterium]
MAPKILPAGVDTFLLRLPTMGTPTLPDGYLLPSGMTMADVRRLERELLTSEGLKIEDLEAGGGCEEDRPPER